MVERAICAGGRFFCRSFCVTRANEIPARKRNRGAGNVPPNCEYMKKVVRRLAGLSQESKQWVWNISTQASPRIQSM